MISQKVSNQGFIVFLVLFYFVCFSEQQFSYSANWGKRNVENRCNEILNLKDYLIDAIPNLEQNIIVNYL